MGKAKFAVSPYFLIRPREEERRGQLSGAVAALLAKNCLSRINLYTYKIVVAVTNH